MFLLGFRRKLTASQSSLLYGGFRHTTELPLQPYQIQLSLGSSLIIFSSFLLFRFLVKMTILIEIKNGQPIPLMWYIFMLLFFRILALENNAKILTTGPRLNSAVYMYLSGARVSIFFYLGSPTNTHQPCADGFGVYTLLSEGLYGCSELNILTPFLPMGRGVQTKSKSKTCTCWLNGCYIYTLQNFTPHKSEKRNICRKNTEFYELIELPS